MHTLKINEKGWSADCKNTAFRGKIFEGPCDMSNEEALNTKMRKTRK